jgi:V/A-type H+-transporting ATPase subunit I
MSRKEKTVMAIEKLVMMNLVGKIQYVDKLAKDLLLFQDIQPVDAMAEIDTGRFTINICERNIHELLGFSHLQSGDSIMNEKEFTKRAKTLESLYENQLKIDKNYFNKEIDLGDAIIKAQEIYSTLNNEYDTLKEIDNELGKLRQSIVAYEYLRQIDIPMEKINGMENFSYFIGSVSKNNAARLKNIYNNVTAIVFHIGDSQDEEVFMIISPKDFDVETKRILRSLNFIYLDGYDEKYTGTPAEIIQKLKEEEVEKTLEQKKVSKELQIHKEKYIEEAKYSYNILSLYALINLLKKNMAFSQDNFYFSGWVSKKERDKLTEILSHYEGIIIIFNDNPSIKPPTKMKNNWLFRPFEFLIRMYGVPSHDEIDPTPFLSITYMFLFGFMFGDVGQGAAVAIIGFILGKKGFELGKIMVRIGISSMFFGAMYGSYFGFEEVLPYVWLRPFDNINQMLIMGVSMGVVLLLIAFSFSIINKLRIKDIKEGVFGKNGIVGLILYISLLILALQVALPGVLFFNVPETILIILAVGMLVLILIREPLANYLMKKLPLYHEPPADYYVENSFELVETLLGMLSNTVSFVRIGAFTLTHAGLFLAFETLAHMIQIDVLSIGVLIFANVLLIVLEGLIVGIQVLRLEFYELFSKYFRGEGVDFQPLKLELDIN